MPSRTALPSFTAGPRRRGFAVIQGKADALRVELQQAGDRKDKGFVKTKVRQDLTYCLCSQACSTDGPECAVLSRIVPRSRIRAGCT